MRLTVMIAGLIAMASTTAIAVPAAAECGPGPVNLELPGQSLAQRIALLSRATGCRIDADPRQIAGKRAPVLVGSVSTDEAIFRSIKGTGLEAGPVQGRWRINREQQTYFDGRIAQTRGRIAMRQKAGKITAATAADYRRSLNGVRRGVAANVLDQGFLSAAELSNYRSTVDRIDQNLR